MPRPVLINGDLGSGESSRPLRIDAYAATGDGTLNITVDYRFKPILMDKVWQGYHIDSLEFAIVAHRVEHLDECMRLPNDAVLIAAGTALIAADGSCAEFSGRNSLRLPVGYFDTENHHTWTLILRSRGCRDTSGATGESRVLSAAFYPASVMLGQRIDPAILEAIRNTTTFKTQNGG